MNLLPREELETLVGDHEYPCLSLYIPTERMGAEVQQNRIRLKNLLQEAEGRLEENGMGRQEVSNDLQPARDLLDDDIFWQHQSDGLAIFLSPDHFNYFHLPLKFESQLVIGKNFHVKPLLPLYSGNGRFFILSLSQDNIRLLEGTRDSVDEIDVESLPANLAEALRHDEMQEHIQWSAGKGASTGGGRPLPTYHGHAVGDDNVKNDILRYFQKIDRGLMELLADERVPLVLAGVEYLLPIYREANSYNHLMEDAITGHPDEQSPEELHEQAWKILEPYFQRDQEEAVDRYAQLSGTGLASNDLTDVLPAAFYGRVDRLFVPLELEVWGTFDPDNRKMTVEQEPTGDNQDLLDLAAVQTFIQGGTVYAVTADQMPDGSNVAAIFRYEH